MANDHEENNTSKTNYRNQINKVANAIEEVIHNLKGVLPSAEGLRSPIDPPLINTEEERNYKELTGTKSLKKSRRWLITLFSVFFSFVLAFLVFRIVEVNKIADDKTVSEKSIAVLPFLNDSPDEENNFFINGIMEEILNDLQKIKDFKVLSRTSTDQFRGIVIPSIPDIAKKLGVNYIVEGSGQKYGDTFRLRVKLLETAPGKELWAETYEQEIHGTKEIFNIQSRIAQAIAEALKAEITPDEKQLIEKTPTQNLTAYYFYRKGFEDLMKYGPDGIELNYQVEHERVGKWIEEQDKL